MIPLTCLIETEPNTFALVEDKEAPGIVALSYQRRHWTALEMSRFLKNKTLLYPNKNRNKSPDAYRCAQALLHRTWNHFGQKISYYPSAELKCLENADLPYLTTNETSIMTRQFLRDRTFKMDWGRGHTHEYEVIWHPSRPHAVCVRLDVVRASRRGIWGASYGEGTLRVDTAMKLRLPGLKGYFNEAGNRLTTWYPGPFAVKNAAIVAMGLPHQANRIERPVEDPWETAAWLSDYKRNGTTTVPGEVVCNWRDTGMVALRFHSKWRVDQAAMALAQAHVIPRWWEHQYAPKARETHDLVLVSGRQLPHMTNGSKVALCLEITDDGDQHGYSLWIDEKSDPGWKCIDQHYKSTMIGDKTWW